MDSELDLEQLLENSTDKTKDSGKLWGQIFGLKGAKDKFEEILSNISFYTPYPYSVVTSEPKKKSHTSSKKGVLGTERAMLLFGPEASGKTCLIDAFARKNHNILYFRFESILPLFKTYEAYTGLEVLLEKVKKITNKNVLILLKNFEQIEELDADVVNHGIKILQKFFKQDAPRGNILIFGTTSFPWLMKQQHWDIFPKKMYIPYPEASVRRDFWKDMLDDLTSSKQVDYYKTISEAEKEIEKKFWKEFLEEGSKIIRESSMLSVYGMRKALKTYLLKVRPNQMSKISVKMHDYISGKEKSANCHKACELPDPVTVPVTAPDPVPVVDKIEKPVSDKTSESKDKKDDKEPKYDKNQQDKAKEEDFRLINEILEQLRSSEIRPMRQQIETLKVFRRYVGIYGGVEGPEKQEYEWKMANSTKSSGVWSDENVTMRICQICCLTTWNNLSEFFLCCMESI